MADVETIPATVAESRLNVADRLARYAQAIPDSLAVVCSHRRGTKISQPQRGPSGALYETITFAKLEADVTRIVNGMVAWEVPKGTRLALLVKPSIDFVALVFALLRAGMVIVLVDPGLGRKNLIRCLTEARPEGFVAVSAAQAVRTVLRKRFPQARWNVTVGRRWFWGGKTLDDLRAMGNTHGASNAISATGPKPTPVTYATDEAAIIFTSGSTGVPKGVLYTQQMFDTQVVEIQAMYGIEAGGIDLGCFPLFALFNAAMGVTTVLPEMDFSRPGSADPEKLLTAANDWKVDQAFASPAVWRLLCDHCARTGARIDSLRQVFSCGAPVPANVLQSTLRFVGAGAKMHTPYGATECLPVSTIEAAEILNETAERTAQGTGVCVGRKFDSIEWRVIRITDEPIANIDETEELSPNEVGELIVRGPQVSPIYVTSTAANKVSKIGMTSIEYSVLKLEEANQSEIPPWHRTGDVGYFDEHGRFWYCGRKSQRVETTEGPIFTECVEAIFNQHPQVSRSALVGGGPRPHQRPVVIVELHPGLRPSASHTRNDLAKHWNQVRLELVEIALAHPITRGIKLFLHRDSLPVDIRHNAKINREELARWTEAQLRMTAATQSVVVSCPHAERGNEGS